MKLIRPSRNNRVIDVMVGGFRMRTLDERLGLVGERLDSMQVTEGNEADVSARIGSETQMRVPSISMNQINHLNVSYLRFRLRLDRTRATDLRGEESSLGMIAPC